MRLNIANEIFTIGVHDPITIKYFQRFVLKFLEKKCFMEAMMLKNKAKISQNS